MPVFPSSPWFTIHIYRTFQAIWIYCLYVYRCQSCPEPPKYSHDQAPYLIMIKVWINGSCIPEKSELHCWHRSQLHFHILHGTFICNPRAHWVLFTSGTLSSFHIFKFCLTVPMFAWWCFSPNMGKPKILFSNKHISAPDIVEGRNDWDHTKSKYPGMNKFTTHILLKSLPSKFR